MLREIPLRMRTNMDKGAAFFKTPRHKLHSAMPGRPVSGPDAKWTPLY
jgi:hypothetical protein